MRNFYRYTKMYSGGEPELIVGEVFKTIVSLSMNMAKKVADKVTDKVADKLTFGEKVFLKSLLPYFNEHEWITNAKVMEYTSNQIKVLMNLFKLSIIHITGRHSPINLCH